MPRPIDRIGSRGFVAGLILLAGSLRGEEVILVEQGGPMRYLSNAADPGIGPGWTAKDFGDADDDGDLAVADAIFLLEHLFLRGPPPPAPFPDRGADPTADGLGCERP